MTDLQPLVGPTLDGLAALLESADLWGDPSLCENWSVGHVVAHVTMPARLTPEQFGAGMAAAGGDFTTMSDAVAARDATLPATDLLGALRSPDLHAWQPPGGGEVGALTHAVIHSLDVTVAVDRPSVAPPAALLAVLDLLAESQGSWFGLELAGSRLEATDSDWAWGEGQVVSGPAEHLVALLAGRTLPDGRRLRKA